MMGLAGLSPVARIGCVGMWGCRSTGRPTVDLWRIGSLQRKGIRRRPSSWHRWTRSDFRRHDSEITPHHRGPDPWLSCADADLVCCDLVVRKSALGTVWWMFGCGVVRRCLSLGVAPWGVSAGLGGQMQTPSVARRRPPRVVVRALATVAFGAMVVMAGTPAPAVASPPSSIAATSAVAAMAGGGAADFGPGAASSADLAVDGFGDARGYHVQVAAERSGFDWREVAVLRPAGLDARSWTGYQCVSGNGRFAAVAVLPQSLVNRAVARDRGAFAFSVDLVSGVVRPLASGVGLKYHSPGCGVGSRAVFSRNLGVDQETTELVPVDLATGRADRAVTVEGQVTSAVPVRGGVVGVAQTGRGRDRA